MAQEREKRTNEAKMLTIQIVGSKKEDGIPNISLYRIDSKSGTIKKIKNIEKGQINSSELTEFLKEGKLGFGPDLPEGEITEEMLTTFTAKTKLADWIESGVISLNSKFFTPLHFVCVEGNVHRCLPIFVGPFYANKISSLKAKLSLDSATFSEELAQPKLPTIPPLHDFCNPVCNAIVEIYERKCCYIDFPVHIPDSIIDELKRLLEKKIIRTPIFPPPPPPPPEEVLYGETIFPTETRRLSLADTNALNTANPKNRARVAKLAEATSDNEPVLGNISEQLMQDIEVMSALSPSERVEYIKKNEYLIPIFCFCSSRKVGQVHVGENGEFAFCYLSWPAHNCTLTYSYKVKQWNGTSWVYIYDGASIHQYFKSTDFARLRTYLGHGCKGQPPQGIPGEFVELESIGSTYSYNLHTPVQNTEYGVSPPITIANAGLVDFGGVPDAPWATTLQFFIRFTEGLQNLPINAKYYRVSVIKADASGQPTGTRTILTNSLGWYKWDYVGGSTNPTPVFVPLSMNPADVGGKHGLVQIPFNSLAYYGWLSNQYHAAWNTVEPSDPSSPTSSPSFPNGKYLLTIELFDASANKICPPGTAAASSDSPAPQERPFKYIRWDTFSGPSATSDVHMPSLTHMFHIDNTPCYADIVSVFKNTGLPSHELCQFIEGQRTDTLGLKFYAFHKNNFMKSFGLNYYRGLDGTPYPIQSGTSNAPTSIPSTLNPDTLDPVGDFATYESNAASSTGVSFDTLLGNAPSPASPLHTRCAFSFRLSVTPKHTNGSSVIWGYGREDNIAIALLLNP